GQLKHVSHAVDLACGNGILGLVAKAKGICDNVAFCDESAMAVASASSNAAALNPDNMPNFEFYQGDALLDYRGPQADLILCNPPFHSNHTVEDYVGRRLLAQAANYLQPSGVLCMVANKHLPYLPTLKNGFSRVEKLAQNKKFNIWLAQK
ncbi:MAG: methyltransferase, partial [Halioglobus sp.]